MKAPARAEFVLSAHPVVAFTGPFGSGKTEVAINYALAARARGGDVLIVDLDIVTPYFRVGDHRARLAEMGVHVVAPEGALASFEAPALPPEIAGALRREDSHVVLDVGGDSAGAGLLGAYAPGIAARGYDMWLVVNPFRPSANSPEAIGKQAEAIATSSGLHVSGLVADPHLGPETRAEHIEAGLAVVCRGARGLGLPVVFLAAEKRLLGGLREPSVPVLALQLFLRPPWE